MTTIAGGPRWTRFRIAFAVVSVASIGAILLIAFRPQPVILPPGATPLTLLTEPWKPLPAWLGCGGAPIAPVTLGRTDGELTFTRAGGAETPLSWPYGWSARTASGRAELVDSSGVVYAVEGAELTDLIGVAGLTAIVVCPPAGH